MASAPTSKCRPNPGRQGSRPPHCPLEGRRATPSPPAGKLRSGPGPTALFTLQLSSGQPGSPASPCYDQAGEFSSNSLVIFTDTATSPVQGWGVRGWGPLGSLRDPCWDLLWGEMGAGPSPGCAQTLQRLTQSPASPARASGQGSHQGTCPQGQVWGSCSCCSSGREVPLASGGGDQGCCYTARGAGPWSPPERTAQPGRQRCHKEGPATASPITRLARRPGKDATRSIYKVSFLTDIYLSPGLG